MEHFGTSLVMNKWKYLIGCIGFICGCYMTFAPRGSFYYRSLWFCYCVIAVVAIFIIGSLLRGQKSFSHVLRAKTISTIDPRWPVLRIWGALFVLAVVGLGIAIITFVLRRN